MKKTETAAGGQQSAEEVYVLRLYIAGISPNSTRAVSNLKTICKKYLTSRYELEIIDVYQQKDRIYEEQLIALPMLVKKKPGMMRRLIGDMSDGKKVLRGLGIYV